jgi:hypothetical protein
MSRPASPGSSCVGFAEIIISSDFALQIDRPHDRDAKVTVAALSRPLLTVPMGTPLRQPQHNPHLFKCPARATGWERRHRKLLHDCARCLQAVGYLPLSRITLPNLARADACPHASFVEQGEAIPPARDLGRNRGHVRHRLPHHGALGSAAIR